MHRARTTATILVLIALLAACSTDDGGTANETTSTTAGASGATTTTATGSDCPSPAETATGTLSRTMTVAGTPREYLVAVPTGYDGTRPVPLVLTFHGLNSNARQQLVYSRWGEVGEKEGFITVSPNAVGDTRRWDFLTPASQPTSDAAFIDALVQEIERTFCIDPSRVYASGMSNGSAVSFGLACRHETPFAAYGAVAAAFYNEAYCGGAPPTSIIYFHGTKDPVVAYDGGAVKVLPGAAIRPAPETLAAWAEHDGCPAPATTSPASDVRLTSWTGCDDDSEVAFYTVIGGGHTWPGSIPVARLGPTTSSIDATELMWAFFQAHPLTG